jgi:mycothiol system anti-sigma-R factor
MNCMETVARLHLYIDRELSDEEVAIVQQHLKDCPSCECRFHFDMGLKRLMHEKCTMKKAPEHLRAAVMRLARTPAGAALEVNGDIEAEIWADIKHHRHDGE